MQFRTWATKVLDTFTKQGYVLDKSRLINGQIFDEDYFEHLIAEIQEIRASERRFYQKITDIYATAVDYDKNSQMTREFYATVQNKMHYAVHGNTAAITQLAGNLNCDFNALNGAICDVRGGVDRLSGQVGFSAERVINSVSQGNLQMIQALKDCCCQTQQNIIKMGYENQLGQKDIVNALQQGFAYTNTGIERAASNLGFQLSQGICDLKTNDNAGVQRIIDTMNGHWNQELQLKYNDSRRELSQRDQTQAIVAGITAAISQIIAANKTTTTTP